MSATGGMANQATRFYKRMASNLAAKSDQPYSTTMSWLRCRLTFSLLRSAILRLCGTQSSLDSYTGLTIDLVATESHNPFFTVTLHHLHFARSKKKKSNYLVLVIISGKHWLPANHYSPYCHYFLHNHFYVQLFNPIVGGPLNSAYLYRGRMWHWDSAMSDFNCCLMNG